LTPPRGKLKLASLGAVARRGCDVFGTTIDTAIGLILVFALFAMLVSTAMEVLAGVFALRSKALANTIAQLIEDPKVESGFFSSVTSLWNMFGAHRDAATAPARAAQTAQRAAASDPAKQPAAVAAAAAATNHAARQVVTFADVYQHALVAGASGNDKPSYVPAANFAAALLQQLSAASPGPVVRLASPPGAGDLYNDIKAGIAALPSEGDLSQALTSLEAQAQGDLDKLRAGIETWFDGAMDRLSGQYKRYTQVITFLLAFALAAAFNVDTLHVARTIYAEPTLRNSLATAAEQQVQAGWPPTNATNATLSNTIGQYSTVATQLSNVAPIGWPTPNRLDLSTWFGWLLTAFAAMMGGPFWFGILSTLVNARNAGPKPESSTSTAK
jgi:hypothetical protein